MPDKKVLLDTQAVRELREGGNMHYEDMDVDLPSTRSYYDRYRHDTALSGWTERPTGTKDSNTTFISEPTGGMEERANGWL